MKKLLLLLLAAGTLAAQTTPQTVNLSATGNGVTLNCTITLTTRAVLSKFTCAPINLYPGDTTVCTVTINQPADPGGFLVTIALPSIFSGPGSVTILAGATNAVFVVARSSASPIASIPVLTTSWTGWTSQPGSSESYAQVLYPWGPS
jgi:hypothetical protein